MKLNKKGFTLVELLAVIVVLAIIMIIAIPAILDRMDEAKKSTFKIYAQKVLNTAITKYETDVLTGNETYKTANGYCYTLNTLNLKKGAYEGQVKVDLSTSAENTNVITYKVRLKDKSFYVNDAEYDDLETAANIKAGNPSAGFSVDCSS